MNIKKIVTKQWSSAYAARGCFSFSELYLLSFSELVGCNNSELKKGEGYKNSDWGCKFSEFKNGEGCKNSKFKKGDGCKNSEFKKGY